MIQYEELIMKIIKVQKRPRDKIVTLPADMCQMFDEFEYMKCTVDEFGIHYSPLEI